MISASKSLYEVRPIISIKCRPASYWYSLTSLQTRSFNEKTKVAPIVFFKFQQLGTLGYPEWKPTRENDFHLLHSCTVLPLYGKGACESNLSLVSFNYRFDRRLWRARWKVICWKKCIATRASSRKGDASRFIVCTRLLLASSVDCGTCLFCTLLRALAGLQQNDRCGLRADWAVLRLHCAASHA